MGEGKFMISEAARKVNVEAHALRYWEEELELDIGRTEMGHRYYTEEDIRLFCCIKKLKNEGMPLRNLKPLLPKLVEKRRNVVKAKKEDNAEEEKNKKEEIEEGGKKESGEKKLAVADIQPGSVEAAGDANSQLAQVRSLIGQVLAEVVAANNEVLEKNISRQMNEEVFGKMDIFFQAKERKEEEHFRKLDCLIRQQQASRKETAKENAKITGIGKLRKIFT